MAGKSLDKYFINRRLVVLVKPNKKKTEILGYDNDRQALIVNVSKPAKDDKANQELVGFFTKKLGLKVRMISGLTSRLKILKLI